MDRPSAIPEGDEVPFRLGWTVLGLLSVVLCFYGGVRGMGEFEGISSMAADDWFTLLALALVSSVWGFYETRSLRLFQHGEPEPPVVSSRMLLEVDEHACMPPGESEVLVEQAMAGHRAPEWMSVGSNVLISLGLAGTFGGLTLGLVEAVPYLSAGGESDVQQGMLLLLGGAKLAFLKSLLGVLLALVWSYRMVNIRDREKRLQSVLQSELDTRHPPVSLEFLHIRAFQRQQTQLTELSGGIADLRKEVQSFKTQEAAHAVRRDELDATHRIELVGSIKAIGQVSAAVQAVREVEEALQAFQESINLVAEELPEKLAQPIGVQVGSVIAPNLDAVANAVNVLGSSGADAVGSVMANRMGDEVSSLQGALTAVSTHLQGLPGVLATGSQQAIQTMEQASLTGAERLGQAASVVAAQTETTGAQLRQLDSIVERLTGALASVESEGTRLGEVLAGVSQPLTTLPESIDQSRLGLEAVGETLRKDIVEQLQAWRDGMQAQSELQRRLAETLAAERTAIETSSRQLVVGLDGLTSRGETLVTAIDHLRSNCASTVAALEAASGSQRDGTRETMEQLLAAVNAFNQALTSSQQSLQDASFQAVASTEQVTAAAARQVAEAMQSGAEGLTNAMARAEAIGQRLDERGQLLDEQVKLVRGAFEQMEQNLGALQQTGGVLAQTLGEASVPLVAARDSLRDVPEAVRSAAQAMESERIALTGLGTSLRDQASLLREQEQSLTVRTQELRGLHQTLGEQWTGHVDRLVQGHDQVKEAWKVAMSASGQGLQEQARKVAEYARQVDAALGLKGEVGQLRESLADLADTLSDLKRVGPGIDALGSEVRRLQLAVQALQAGDPSTRPTAPGRRG